MQVAQCFVRLGGDVGMEVFKEGVTVPELLVLRDAHGADSVVRIRLTGSDRRAQKEEVDRLARLYGAERVMRLFPGAVPRLPVKFEEIGVTPTWKDEGAPLPSPPDLDEGDDESNDGPQGKD